MTDFTALRWPDGPVCPWCGSKKVYRRKRRQNFKCAACGGDYSVTTGTIFASRKMPLERYAEIVERYVSGADRSVLQMSIALGLQYKTA